MLTRLWLVLVQIIPAAFHFAIATSYFSIYLSETVKIHRLLAILVSSRVMVWFTSPKGGDNISFWSGNTARNFSKKYRVFSDMTANENCT
jgi:hypothetical protein